MNPAQSISSVFRQYFGFSGRASRSEYWWFVLFEFIAIFVLAFISPFLWVIFFVAVFVPGLAVLVRRLHDTNRTDWWLLLSIIPFGSIVLLIFAVFPGQQGQNKYGPDPLGSSGDVAFVDAGVGLEETSGPGFCTDCGSELQAGATFCRSGGAAV